VVLAAQEVRGVLHHQSGSPWLVACLLYEPALRLMEAVHMQVKDLDFDHRAILVRDGKGTNDRVVTVPDGPMGPLWQHLETVRLPHDQDLADGFGAVSLPFALERKYPNAPRAWHWQYVLRSGSRSVDPRSGVERRHRLDESSIQEAIRAAVRKAGVHKPASSRTLPHPFAIHLLGRSTDSPTVQEQLGHRDLRTTQIYTHVLRRGGSAVISALNVLLGAGGRQADQWRLTR
jgi:site-specific recombinase XerD